MFLVKPLFNDLTVFHMLESQIIFLVFIVCVKDVNTKLPSGKKLI